MTTQWPARLDLQQAPTKVASSPTSRSSKSPDWTAHKRRVSFNELVRVRFTFGSNECTYFGTSWRCGLLTQKDDRTPHEAVNPTALSREDIDEVIEMRRRMQRMEIVEAAR